MQLTGISGRLWSRCFRQVKRAMVVVIGGMEAHFSFLTRAVTMQSTVRYSKLFSSISNALSIADSFDCRLNHFFPLPGGLWIKLLLASRHYHSANSFFQTSAKRELPLAMFTTTYAFFATQVIKVVTTPNSVS